jgi:hypothetical protein
MSQQENKDESINLREGSISQSTKVEISERTLSIVAFGISIAAIVIAMWSHSEADKAARETRILQQIVQDQSAIMVGKGLKQPTDDGPLHLNKEKAH